jgi:hypothetical protein
MTEARNADYVDGLFDGYQRRQNEVDRSIDPKSQRGIKDAADNFVYEREWWRTAEGNFVGWLIHLSEDRNWMVWEAIRDEGFDRNTTRFMTGAEFMTYEWTRSSR